MQKFPSNRVTHAARLTELFQFAPIMGRFDINQRSTLVDAYICIKVRKLWTVDYANSETHLCICLIWLIVMH